MSFFFKKKLIQDRLAGLSFRWRGGARSNSSGAVVASIATATFALFLLYGISVETPQFTVKEKIAAHQVFQVNANDPQIQALRQFASPLPDRWDPSDDPRVNRRIITAMRLGHLQSKPRPLSLIPTPKESYDLSLPKVIDHNSLLSRLGTPSKIEKPESGRCEVVLSFSSPALQDDQLSKLPAWPQPLDWDLRGTQASYILSVNSNGKVELCTPVSKHPIPKAEPWLRALKFKPSEKAQRISKVILTVKGLTP